MKLCQFQLPGGGRRVGVVEDETVVDAFIEGYHTPGTHPQVLRPTEGVDPSARPALIEEFARAPFSPTFTFRNHSVTP